MGYWLLAAGYSLLAEPQTKSQKPVARTEFSEFW
jgi:hypothetical protein